MRLRTRRVPPSLSMAAAVAAVLSPPGERLVRGAEPAGLVAAGTRWETPFFVVDSGVAGPTVLVTGGIHGNEPAGSRAAEQIRHWPIVRGRLVVVPRVNVTGLAARTRIVPNSAADERDLNRAFPVDSQGMVTPRGSLATAVWNFVLEQKPAWVIDLHEGFEFHVSHRPKPGVKRSVGSSIIYEANETLAPYVDRALAAANSHVTDPSKEFVPLRRGPVAGSLARAAARGLGARAMILETTYRRQPLSLRTRQHRAMVNALLNDIGLVDRDCSRIVSADGKD